MGYMVIADKLNMGALGDWEFGFAPKHPVLNENMTAIVKHMPGKFYAGETFEWLGDPENPEVWTSPADEEAEAAFARQAARKANAKKAQISALEAQLEALRAEVASVDPEDATLDGTEPSGVASPPSSAMAKARAAKKAKAATTTHTDY